MKQLLAAGIFLWAGLLIGVSFVATPAKFLAPSLPLAQALDVGRWTFHVLSLLEWGLLALAVISVAFGRMWLRDIWRLEMIFLAGIAATLALQSMWLRPVLDARVHVIIEGGSVAQSSLHNAYIALEIIKLNLLLVAGGNVASQASTREPF